MDRKVFIFTRSRRSPLQGRFRWSFPRPEDLGCSVKPLRGKSASHQTPHRQPHTKKRGPRDFLKPQNSRLFSALMYN
jgi:hypothetical protein